MAQQGTSLQAYNNDLVRLIEKLREDRATLDREIAHHQEDKVKIERDIAILNQRLRDIDEALTTKTAARAEYDKTIRESDLAYNSIVESSKKLVGILRERTGGGR